MQQRFESRSDDICHASLAVLPSLRDCHYERSEESAFVECSMNLRSNYRYEKVFVCVILNDLSSRSRLDEESKDLYLTENSFRP